MNPIELTGLRANLPIGAMAAFGCLRVCQRLPGFRGAKLSWAGGGSVDHAVLWAPPEATPETLVAALVADVQRVAERPELKWSEQIKTASPADFRAAARPELDAASHSSRDAVDWFAALANELVRDREGRIEPTPFDMSVARQKFLADALRLAGGLAEQSRGRHAKATADAYREALFGPWMYEDDQHSLGWDPSTMKLGAFTHKAPTAMVNAGVRAAVWLAFESLPFYPCFCSAGLAVPSFQRKGRGFTFCWPVWRSQVGADTLRSLLAWAELTRDAPSAAELSARGVTALYRSVRFKPNKYLLSFRNAELAFAATR
jgi:hypothetical protein